MPSFPIIAAPGSLQEDDALMEEIQTEIAVALLLAAQLDLSMAMLFATGYLLEPSRQSRIGCRKQLYATQNERWQT